MPANRRPNRDDLGARAMSKTKRFRLVHFDRPMILNDRPPVTHEVFADREWVRAALVAAHALGSAQLRVRTSRDRPFPTAVARVSRRGWRSGRPGQCRWLRL